jgi:hypothetical protein
MFSFTGNYSCAVVQLRRYEALGEYAQFFLVTTTSKLHETMQVLHVIVI